MPQNIVLPEVNEVQVTIIVDNSLDILMASTDVAKRFPLPADVFRSTQPIAEHGFSALVQVKRGSNQGTILYDTGVSSKGTLHNIDALQIDTKAIQAIVISHGHGDHCMGLPGLMQRMGARNVPLILHPEAYLERKFVLPNGFEPYLAPPRKSDLQKEGVEVIEEVGPSMLVDEMVLVSGEIARTTPFETGIPIHWAKREGTWEPDPFITDDQCIIVNVRNRGLVIVTGCSHAGIINVVRNAQAITGIHEIYAIIGGLHLTGGLFEKIIPQTVAALEEINPRYLVACHCTGWKAIQEIGRTLPDAYIPNSVGTTYLL
jgi:7,8-dihydropterin-6-yl-methyl-4-(beta-D-ribofuranosyl)aminobenzene 5'-phosphate synthase